MRLTKSRFNHILAVMFLMLGGLGTLSCTRNLMPSGSIRLVVPFNGSNSSFSTGDVLQFAVINVQAVGKPPLVRKFEFSHDGAGGIPWGQPVDLVVDNVPNGPGMLVQFMGGFKTAAGAFLITYGDATVDVGSGNNTVNITAAPAGTATREGRVAGRFFNAMGSLSIPTPKGPTGDLVAYYAPPNGKPRMAVERNGIVNGWFDVFVLDGIPLTWEVAKTQEVLFDGAITMGSAALAGATPQVLKVATPAYFTRNYNGTTSSIEPRPPGEYTLGYFKSGSITMSMSSYSACYASDVSEGMVGWYGSISLAGPIKYEGSGGTNADVHPVLGGSPMPYASLFTGQVCNPSSGNTLVLYHHLLREGGDGFAGMSPPFRITDPFTPYGGFLRSKFDGVSNPNKISLQWAYLAGASPGDVDSGIHGVDIIAKYSQTGGDDGGHNMGCADYISRGYVPVGSVTTSASSFDYSPSGLSSNNYYGWQFAACAYVMDPDTNLKRYVGSVIRSSCTGNCGEIDQAGWGVSALTISNGTYSGVSNSLGAHFGQVLGVDATTSDFYTHVQVASGSSGFATLDRGSEVLLMVMAEGHNGDCSPAGWAGPGARVFTRILDAGSSYVRIPKGSFIDDLDPTYLPNSPSPGTKFCWIQAIKVPHFTNLTVAGTLSESAFSFGSGGTGIVALRVSDKLAFDASAAISVSGSGYSGGMGSKANGAGILGNYSMTMPGGNSGGYGSMTVSGGGGGAGPVANGGSGALSVTGGGWGPMQGGGMGMMMSLFMGGGGGGTGGKGGGAVFIVTRELFAASGAAIKVSGADAGNPSPVGGGGGAGTVALVAHRAVGTLAIEAMGGAGSPGSSDSGGGGGGLYQRLICHSDLFTENKFLAGGAAGAVGASPGEVGQAPADYSTQGYDWFCK